MNFTSSKNNYLIQLLINCLQEREKFNKFTSKMAR